MQYAKQSPVGYIPLDTPIYSPLQGRYTISHSLSGDRAGVRISDILVPRTLIKHTKWQVS